MGFFGDDSDSEYQTYLEDGSMFGKMDRDEWDQIQERAMEISTGFSNGVFEKDERVWEQVRRIMKID